MCICIHIHMCVSPALYPSFFFSIVYVYMMEGCDVGCIGTKTVLQDYNSALE